VGAKTAIAAVNGTAALQVALYSVGVKPNDLVICPTLTFIATANAISYCGALPLFADSETTTLGLCPRKLEQFLSEKCELIPNGLAYQGRRIAACVPVHIFGHAMDIEAILDICKRYGIAVVEDATESLGSVLGGRALGTFGSVGVFSFNGNKIITTGGGGMLVTDDPPLAQRLKHLTTTARVKHQWHFIHDEVGWNYRMPNLNAALGCAQLEQLPSLLASKRSLAALYRERTADLNGVRFVDEPEGSRSNFWLNAFVLADIDERDHFLQETRAAGIETRPCWVPMHQLHPYQSMPRCDALAGAEDIFSRLVNIPSSPSIWPH
jgi:perosamine synthetase